MILFLKSWLFALLFYSLHADKSSCYNSNGEPVACEPLLDNIAQRMRIEATSTCGIKGAENICTEWLDKFGKMQQSCEICDVTNPKLSKPSSMVADPHIRGKETCWMSEGLKPSLTTTSVNVTVGLKKRSFISYITVELCGHNPDGIIIYKMDKNLEDWFPWQYFARDCVTTFGMEHLYPDMNPNLSFDNMLKPFCFDLEKSIDYGGEEKLYRVLAYNPKQGRLFNSVFTENEQEWLTATDVRISYVLMPKSAEVSFLTRAKRETEPRVFHFGSSDITIGGQPVCNGHAHKVKENTDGTYQCECQHSTTGRDCEKCHPEFNDQPWSAATVRKPAICKRCECNNHANTCKFDINVYLKTERQHGSHCINCEHNTAGPQCDQCAPGYFRNRAFPIYHKNACEPCFCHSIGSYPGKPCDPISGKCFCKLGVTGEKCSQCKEGYKQTDSLTKPCKKVRNHYLISKDESGCGFCQKRPRRINFKRFCSKQLIFKVTLKSKESRGQWMRFIVNVDEVWNRKHPDNRVKLIGLDNRATISIWVQKDMVDCQCIDFDFGRSYLIMANVKTREFMGQTQMVLSQSDVVEEWNEDWEESFARFNKFDRLNKCNKFSRLRRNANLRRFIPSYSYNQYASYT